MTSPRPNPWHDSVGTVAIRCAQVLLVLAVTTILVYVAIVLKVVFIPVLIALIIASACAPIMSFLRSKGVPSVLATVMLLLAAVLVIGGLVTLIVVTIRADWDKLTEATSKAINDLVEFVTHGPIPIDGEQLDAARQSLLDFVSSGGGQIASGALAGVSVVGEIATGIVLGIVVLFFFLKDGPQIWQFLTKPFRGAAAARADRIATSSVRVFGGYVRGTTTIAFVDAAGIGITLFILQVPLALPLALLVFVGSFIPIVGATLTGILAALVALVSNGPFVALIVIIAVIVVQQLEGNLLQPVVMGNALKLHSLVVLLALAIGTLLGGILGAILSAPIAAVIWTIIKVWREPAAETDAIESDTIDPAPDDTPSPAALPHSPQEDSHVAP